MTVSETNVILTELRDVKRRLEEIKSTVDAPPLPEDRIMISNQVSTLIENLHILSGMLILETVTKEFLILGDTDGNNKTG